MATKLFVGGLAWATTDDKLREFFAAAGTVVSANVITDKFTGKSKGFGFVEMSTDEEAQAATEKLNGQNLDGRTIVVNEARPLQPRENKFRSGGGDRGGRGFDRRDRN
ncbi:RNA-binding protein [Candidatus Giovannonibacteria bacterium RIFCSPLOWO2_01_FULL_46_13]|uniref:RNA-binding protein n=1 Tax=Candidatus Giovannonibacteria bacterium RIFCSPLOWO2_01_FULL_46_13 TaxID=1798352 RepID=A0A1F5X5B5_9BACT|nr:MAG: RNA-binding protein [Candidatus Giovannonibacteria bacterium RIFCSPLOWO2_01_FULL_46_13]